MIWSSWADAKAGAVANVVVLAAVVVGAAMNGPSSLRAQYDRDVAGPLAETRIQALPVVTEADLAPLPAPVQRYLRLAGVVGHPRVANFRARMRGRIRSGPEAAWMPLQAEQHNFIDQSARHFYMTASMFLLPIDGYHRFVGSEATMLVKAFGLIPVANNAGPEMAQAETVTVFNDMCLMAPATLIDPAIQWEHGGRAHRSGHVHPRSERGSRRPGLQRRGRAGELLVRRSPRASADGGAMTPLRWSTPVRAIGPSGPSG